MNYLENDLYNKSNGITEVQYLRFSKDEYRKLLNCGTSYKERLKYGQKLLNYLCDKYSIPRCHLRVADKPQLSFSDGKTLGRYYPKIYKIEIFNLTAKTHKVVSIKTFANTLIHEFIHHYDIEKLGFGKSPHTKGFYLRISDLERKLS